MDDDIELCASEARHELTIKQRLAKRKPSDPEAMTLAKSIIRGLLTLEPKPNVAYLMAAASEVVDTVSIPVRNELRAFITENGGSLKPDAERIRELFYPPMSDQVFDKTWHGGKLQNGHAYRVIREEPNEHSLPYDSPLLTAAHCRFPVGFFRPFAQSENLCCGRRVGSTKRLAKLHAALASRYCPTHTRLVLKPGSAKPVAPAVIPPSRRTNLAAKAKRVGRSTVFDSY